MPVFPGKEKDVGETWSLSSRLQCDPAERKEYLEREAVDPPISWGWKTGMW
jgi:hypothetical protein